MEQVVDFIIEIFVSGETSSVDFSGLPGINSVNKIKESLTLHPYFLHLSKHLRISDL
uniref:Uncharacterized protein n=1 Tax=Rhizophora mucronata TaxID=61149 RepID=A0A2P2QLA9_RHIMU